MGRAQITRHVQHANQLPRAGPRTREYSTTHTCITASHTVTHSTKSLGPTALLALSKRTGHDLDTTRGPTTAPRYPHGGIRAPPYKELTSENYAKKSAANSSNPLSVKTCEDILSKTFGGIVHISAPTPKATPTD